MYQVEEYNTSIALKDNSYLEIVKIQNNEKSVEHIHLDDIIVNADEKNNSITSSERWQYIRTENGNTLFKSFTYGLVVGILASVVTAGFGPVPSSIISGIASAVVSESIPKLYYERIIHHYREGPALVTKVRYQTSFFYDAQHRNYMDTVFHTYEGRFPW
jgi:hypothetical protein